MNVSGSGGASGSASGDGGVSASEGGGISASGSAGISESGSGGAADGEAGSSGTPESGGIGGAGEAVSGAGGAVSGAGGIGGAGGVSGAGGQGGGKPTCQSAQATAKLLIDDLEDGNYAIQPISPYGGTWYVFNDGTGTQLPDKLSIFKPVTPGYCTPKFAARTYGDSFTIWGAGLGVTFFDFGEAHAFNASDYRGIQFWAKANAPPENPTFKVRVKVMVGITGTTAVENGGTCVPIDNLICEDHYYLRPSPILTQEWTFYKITFSDVLAFGQAGFGPDVPFDQSQVLSLQFLVTPSLTSPAFDFSVDDVAFF
ncbi:MAG TPA: hypothetical protein VJV79_14480 [Polyangiaceae bacterium]|nr:hypothetical protein [Polyangiaceae bacterium]